eukprot:12214175-Alexandrium_andersonii.AAC.1
MAQKVLALIESSPQPLLHHRVTQDFMAKHMGALKQMASGNVPWQDLPSGFRADVGKLRFVPVAETTIERKHAVTTRVRKRGTRSRAVMKSLANRLPVLTSQVEWAEWATDAGQRLASELPDNVRQLQDRLLAKFALACDVRVVPDLLGIQQHPLLLELQNRHARADLSKYMPPVLVRIIYRADLHSKFNDLSGVKGKHDKQKFQLAKAQTGALKDVQVEQAPVPPKERGLELLMRQA